MRSAALTAVLVSTFFGVFTVIAAPTIYFTICTKRFTRAASIASFTTTLALYALAGIYTIAVLVTLSHNPRALDHDYPNQTPTLDQISTMVLTLTAVVSTAVVWSRVWVLWGRRDQVLYTMLLGASLLILSITFSTPPQALPPQTFAPLHNADVLPPRLAVVGAFATTDEGEPALDSGPSASPSASENQPERALWIGGFYWNTSAGVAVCWLTAFMNVVALIMYLVKALKLRSESAQALSARRRVGRHCVRVLESGALFAIIWLFMIIYSTGTQAGDGGLPTTGGFSFFVNGALISLLGSGAALVILLAATGYSETAFLERTAYDEQDVPLSGEK